MHFPDVNSQHKHLSLDDVSTLPSHLHLPLTTISTIIPRYPHSLRPVCNVGVVIFSHSPHFPRAPTHHQITCIMKFPATITLVALAFQIAIRESYSLDVDSVFRFTDNKRKVPRVAFKRAKNKFNARDADKLMAMLGLPLPGMSDMAISDAKTVPLFRSKVSKGCDDDVGHGNKPSGGTVTKVIKDYDDDGHPHPQPNNNDEGGNVKPGNNSGGKPHNGGNINVKPEPDNVVGDNNDKPDNYDDEEEDDDDEEEEEEEGDTESKGGDKDIGTGDGDTSTGDEDTNSDIKDTGDGDGGTVPEGGSSPPFGGMFDCNAITDGTGITMGPQTDLAGKLDAVFYPVFIEKEEVLEFVEQVMRDVVRLHMAGCDIEAEAKGVAPTPQANATIFNIVMGDTMESPSLGGESSMCL